MLNLQSLDTYRTEMNTNNAISQGFLQKKKTYVNAVLLLFWGLALPCCDSVTLKDCFSLRPVSVGWPVEMGSASLAHIMWHALLSMQRWDDPHGCTVISDCCSVAQTWLLSVFIQCAVLRMLVVQVTFDFQMSVAEINLETTYRDYSWTLETLRLKGGM